MQSLCQKAVHAFIIEIIIKKYSYGMLGMVVHKHCTVRQKNILLPAMNLVSPLGGLEGVRRLGEKSPQKSSQRVIYFQ